MFPDACKFHLEESPKREEEERHESAKGRKGFGLENPECNTVSGSLQVPSRDALRLNRR